MREDDLWFYSCFFFHYVAVDEQAFNFYASCHKRKLNQRHRRFIDDNYNTFHARDIDYDNGEFLKITNHSGQLGFGSFGGKIENEAGIWGDPHIFNTSHKETSKQSIDSVFHDESVSINSSEKQVFTCGEVFIDYTKVSCTPEPDALIHARM